MAEDLDDPLARVRVVLDTNVLVAATRSRQRASYALVSSIPSTVFQPCLSVSLYAEWQDVLSRPEHVPAAMTPGDALGFVRYLAFQSHLQEIHFLWRPVLPDSDDDMVLELAVAAGSIHHHPQRVRLCRRGPVWCYRDLAA